MGKVWRKENAISHSGRSSVITDDSYDDGTGTDTGCHMQAKETAEMSQTGNESAISFTGFSHEISTKLEEYIYIDVQL